MICKQDLRRRRAETSVEIRKQKKEETLLKRRNVDISDDEPGSPLQEQNKVGNWCRAQFKKIVALLL